MPTELAGKAYEAFSALGLPYTSLVLKWEICWHKRKSVKNVHPLIYIPYGLSFYTMGVSIALQNNKRSELKFARTLWMLSAFGFVHGLAEWTHLFAPFYHFEFGSMGYHFPDLLQMIILTVSYIFLFQYGVASLVSHAGSRIWKLLYFIPGGLVIIWAGLTFFVFQPHFPQEWFLNGETFARYLLGFPGALVAGIAFIAEKKEFNSFGLQRLERYLIRGAYVFFFYSIVTGLIVPEGPLFPATVINEKWFITIFHVPVQIVRAFCSICIAFYVIKLMKVFNIEYQKRLENAEINQQIYLERIRIGNSLHDGVIQSLYAVGLMLEHTSHLLEERSDQARDYILKALDNLNKTTKGIRNYIINLDREDNAVPMLNCLIKEVIDEFNIPDRRTIIFNEDKVPNWLNEWTQAHDHICMIIKEALSNAIKHGRADLITVRLAGDSRQAVLEVVDNGAGRGADTGFMPNAEARGRGTSSMKKRAGLLNGKIEFHFAQGGGRVLVIINPV